ncbi:Dabb family protein [Mucilaginibacter robiniae]|uniref:Dabb family protein n=1 Tax=Mucilaginibacter robiniae TaxID=2728022 RepID=A0A7L5DXT5_9SPHI|nr:Dabb family protein [Mucilaginibacter robiniae]QJD95922.1 Dabb family protein [Mucilaginibacter robiniae]
MKKIRHIVLLKFKEDCTPEQVKKIEDAFISLQSAIQEIVDLEWGLNNSPENLNDGFTHGFVLTFNTEAERQTYLVHPSHVAFTDLLKNALDKVLVFDYSA